MEAGPLEPERHNITTPQTRNIPTNTPAARAQQTVGGSPAEQGGGNITRTTDFHSAISLDSTGGEKIQSNTANTTPRRAMSAIQSNIANATPRRAVSAPGNPTTTGQSQNLNPVTAPTAYAKQRASHATFNSVISHDTTSGERTQPYADIRRTMAQAGNPITTGQMQYLNPTMTRLRAQHTPAPRRTTFAHMNPITTCLLYTSPSPRD